MNTTQQLNATPIEEVETRPFNIYLAGALGGSKDIETALHFYDAVAAELERRGFNVFVPHKAFLTNPKDYSADSFHEYEKVSVTSEEIFQTDLGAIDASDVIVAVLDDVSHGVGCELGYSYAQMLPILGVVRDDKPNVSKFIEGQLSTYEFGDLQQYDYADAEMHIADLVEEFLDETMALVEKEKYPAINIEVNSDFGDGSPEARGALRTVESVEFAREKRRYDA